MILNQKVARYKSDLAHWARSVETARSNHDAFRLAANKPVPAALIRSLRSLYSSQTMQAEARVEKNLSDRLDHLGGDDPTILNLMRLTQGHWPRLYRKIEEMRRKAQAAAKAADEDPN